MELDFEYQEEFRKNSRGVQLFTCRWVPFSSPKALVFLCHGYGMECSGFMRDCGIRLACASYAVFGIDYEGHGRSEGARCFIDKFDNIVNDCYDFFKSVSDQEEYKGKGRFLYGESMGGAVTLLLHKKDPSFWDGAVLVAPMCKISEKVKPHPVVINILTRVEDVIPKWKIVPTKDVIEAAFKDPVKRDKIRMNKLIYQAKPRLKTALEMLRTSMRLEESLNEVTLPFFVLHGEADTVTDPEISRALYEQASSTDKTIKLYPGMWHGLTSGEPDENIEIVFADIIGWLDKHTTHASFVTIEPIQSSSNYGIERMATTSASVGKVNDRKNLEQTQRHGNYFCGLKGRRMLHHSAM
ncbi:caffeoylshikimate esterase-like [Quillaja saponaria]|uniref:Caffeoylshikimate esterase-like n=1 Tax=Quillaja saponaria TaxID=32244 RepID=A0AAD7VER2_QUISA|nr:caffeoylshikimate esterase-like [Quillaja saponaria]